MTALTPISYNVSGCKSSMVYSAPASAGTNTTCEFPLSWAEYVTAYLVMLRCGFPQSSGGGSFQCNVIDVLVTLATEGGCISVKISEHKHKYTKLNPRPLKRGVVLADIFLTAFCQIKYTKHFYVIISTPNASFDVYEVKFGSVVWVWVVNNENGTGGLENPMTIILSISKIFEKKHASNFLCRWESSFP